ncbi:hypothetical protein SPMU_21560 [Sphingomonas mucosissima]|uniref:Uncharacterized protein n=1 Tax=Sphingomonas mucosissima TaxID=370959 RepID=A0A245ZJ34_9SPHN|nr:hypothetical protein SPMU_21560 [Sphingomonas mucosissima]
MGDLDPAAKVKRAIHLAVWHRPGARLRHLMRAA